VGDKSSTDELAQWLADWYPTTFRTAFLILGDTRRAEDAVQEAFLRLWRFRDALPSGEGARPWLYRIVVNSCYSLARYEGRHDSRAERDGGEVLESVAAAGLGPEELVERAARVEAVRAALEALPEMLRIPVVLRYYSGLSEREIAVAIRRRAGTVKSRLHEARRILSGDPRLIALVVGQEEA
jgi:RNA polymerase sigma-70 factor (ECF subfamily)